MWKIFDLSKSFTVFCIFFAVAGAWADMIWYCGRTLQFPIQVSSLVQFFQPWYLPATPWGCRHTWHITYNPFWTMTIINRWEAKWRRLQEEHEHGGYQAVRSPQPPQQREKIRDREVTIILIQQLYPQLQSYPHLLWNTLQRGPFPPQDIMDTRFLRANTRQTNITTDCQRRLPGPISILRDPSLENFRWENIILLRDMFHPCTPVRCPLWCILLLGMAALPCILPRDMRSPQCIFPQDEWPLCTHQLIQCSLSLLQGKNYNCIMLISYFKTRNRHFLFNAGLGVQGWGEACSHPLVFWMSWMSVVRS